jgi:hypothetical protein
MDLVANSTPMVDLDSKLNSFLVNLESRLDFPTPESPIRTTRNKIINILDISIKMTHPKHWPIGPTWHFFFIDFNSIPYL